MGIHITHAWFPVKFRKIVRQICIFCLKTSTTRWKIPIIFRIILNLCAIADITIIFQEQILRICCFRNKFISIMQIIPTHGHFDIKIADVQVHGREINLMLVVNDTIVTITMIVYIDIISMKRI